MRVALHVALILVLVPRLAAAEPSAEHLAMGQKDIAENRFKVMRTLRDYDAKLSRFRMRRPNSLRYGAGTKLSFSRLIRRLPADAVWLDAGAGAAGAARDYLAEGGKAAVVALSVKIPDEKGVHEAIAEAEQTARFRYLEGEYIEKYSAASLREAFGAASRSGGQKSANVITDLFGPLSYSTTPHLVLQRYVDVLANGGFIFVHLADSYSSVTDTRGKNVSLSKWIAALPGLQVKSLPRSGRTASFIVRKVTDRIEIPPLKLTEYFTEAPPYRAFTSDGTAAAVAPTSARTRARAFRRRRSCRGQSNGQPSVERGPWNTEHATEHDHTKESLAISINDYRRCRRSASPAQTRLFLGSRRARRARRAPELHDLARHRDELVVALIEAGFGSALRCQRRQLALLGGLTPGGEMRGVQPLPPEQRAYLSRLRAGSRLPLTMRRRYTAVKCRRFAFDHTSVCFAMTSNMVLDPGLALDSQFRRADVSRHVGRDGVPQSSSVPSTTSSICPERPSSQTQSPRKPVGVRGLRFVTPPGIPPSRTLEIPVEVVAVRAAR